jgi:hypothetical protein
MKKSKNYKQNRYFLFSCYLDACCSFFFLLRLSSSLLFQFLQKYKTIIKGVRENKFKKKECLKLLKRITNKHIFCLRSNLEKVCLLYIHSIYNTRKYFRNDLETPIYNSCVLYKATSHFLLFSYYCR